MSKNFLRVLEYPLRALTSALSLAQEILSYRKLLSPRYSVTPLLERYRKCPVQKSPWVLLFSQ